MLVALLGILDILLGIFIIVPSLFPKIALTLAVIVLAKGIFSILGGIVNKFYLDVFGWIDVIAGGAMIFNANIWWIGVLILIKGAYSVIAGSMR